MIKRGPILDRRAAPELQPLDGFSGAQALSYTLVDVPLSVSQDVAHVPADVTASQAMDRLLQVQTLFVLNLCCGHRRAGDVADLCSRVSCAPHF